MPKKEKGAAFLKVRTPFEIVFDLTELFFTARELDLKLCTDP